MLELRTPSRLHFGLLAFNPDSPRQFGGLGVMIQQPDIALRLEPSSSPGIPAFTASGPMAAQAAAFANRVAAQGTALNLFPPPGPAHLHVLRTPRPHTGLGTGTQLGMAVARAVSTHAGRPDLDAPTLAALADRGQRSAIGAYGFAQGGLILEAGKPQPPESSPSGATDKHRLRSLSVSSSRPNSNPHTSSPDPNPKSEIRNPKSSTNPPPFPPTPPPSLLKSKIKNQKSEISSPLSPLILRHDFPPDWRILLIIPARLTGIAGDRERSAFVQMPAIPRETTAEMCRLVLLGLLPAALERDLNLFGESLYQLQQIVGRCFAFAQGGIYADPFLSDLAQHIRAAGVPGVGQSSWGPTLYAVTATESDAAALAANLQKKFALADEELLITAADNQGGRITT